MGIPVLLIGKSGSGKSTSLRNFAEDEILLVNVLEKPLPFRKKFKYIYESDNYSKIKTALTRMPNNIKAAIIDDAGYLLTNQFMDNHSTYKTGNAIFELYNSLADNFYNFIKFVKKDLPKDKIVYFIMHEEKNESGDIRPKTVGKLLDEKVCLEGVFTIALRSTISNKKYVFRTNSDNLDVCKSPIDMFADIEIENDLKFVDSTIREFYEIKGEKKND